MRAKINKILEDLLCKTSWSLLHVMTQTVRATSQITASSDERESHGDSTPPSSMTIQSRSTLDFLFSWQSQWEKMQRTIRWRHVSVGRPTVAWVRFIYIQPVLCPCGERSFERTRWLCQLLRRRRCAVFECNSILKMVLWQQKAKLRAFMKQQA